MKCRISVLLLICLLLSGCGGFSGSAFFDAGGAGTLFASGTVSIVHLTFVSDGHGNSTTVTVVTLLQTSSAQELTFCGSHVSDFPMNAFVTANYTEGPTCSNLISVKVSR